MEPLWLFISFYKRAPWPVPKFIYHVKDIVPHLLLLLKCFMPRLLLSKAWRGKWTLAAMDRSSTMSYVKRPSFSSDFVPRWQDRKTVEEDCFLFLSFSLSHSFSLSFAFLSRHLPPIEIVVYTWIGHAQVQVLDKIKLVFIYRWFSIAWKRKTVLENGNMFCLFLKYPSLA